MEKSEDHKTLMQEPSHSAKYVPVMQGSTGALPIMNPHISLGPTLQEES
jgi:hypothetical protein